MTIQDVLNKRHGADGQCVRRIEREYLKEMSREQAERRRALVA